MKTVQDWGFISKDQGLVKPKLQENKIFHALTSAYENNQQHEIYGATENIIRREKELCEMALADLRKLSDSKGEGDPTLKLIMDHYSTRLHTAREKEEKINHLSEDSRKMTEEYKKKTQELADVKRNLMESQNKLRELAKSTEKLLKREEELRFIESNLRTEIDKNKRNIINGLYEIVADLPEPGSLALPAASEPATASLATPQPAAAPSISVPRPIPTQSPAQTAPEDDPMGSRRPFHQGLFRPAVQSPFAASEAKAESLTAKKEETPWYKEDAVRPAHLFAEPAPAMAPMGNHSPVSAPSGPVILKPGDLQEKAVRLKMFEPGKSLCAKSMVKTAEGEVISEYFYSPNHGKESRHYIFNTLFAFSSLLTLKTKDEETFGDRLETIFTDLLSRLEHSQNIHLESFLGEELNKDVLDRLLSRPRDERIAAFDHVAGKVLARIEGVGPARAGLIDQQFKLMPPTTFPPNGRGISA